MLPVHAPPTASHQSTTAIPSNRQSDINSTVCHTATEDLACLSVLGRVDSDCRAVGESMRQRESSRMAGTARPEDRYDAHNRRSREMWRSPHSNQYWCALPTICAQPTSSPSSPWKRFQQWGIVHSRQQFGELRQLCFSHESTARHGFSRDPHPRLSNIGFRRSYSSRYSAYRSSYTSCLLASGSNVSPTRTI